MKPFAGQTAVVTGAARGIGRAIALELAAAGADVLVHTRAARHAAEAVTLEIHGMGGAADCVVGDLAEPGFQDELVRRAYDWRPAIDIWVNNAGVDLLTGEQAGWPFEKKLAALWSVDVVATVRLSRAVGARMREAGKGAIVNIGWDQAEHGMAGDSGELFAAAKGAVIAFTRSLAHSLAPHVRVNCVAPGWIRTAWGEDASEYWQRRAVDESLLARWGVPHDVATAVAFLVSPSAAYITGQVLPINGGLRRAAEK